MAELFQDYEINRKPRWPHLARTLAGSIVLHGLLVAAVAYLPTVQAALHLVGMMSEADYVSEDYTLGEIQERATIIKLSDPNQKLYYPAGYFETNAPDAPIAEVIQEAAHVEVAPTPRKPRPTPTPDATPTPTPAASPEAAVAGDVKSEATATPLTEEEQRAKEEKERRAALDKLAEEKGVGLPPKINAKPYKDLLAKWNEKYTNGELNLKGSVNVTLEADREEDGTLVNMVMTGDSANDPSLKELANDVVMAISASHALAFLKDTRHLKMTLTLDNKKLWVEALTSVSSPEQASAMAGVYGLGIWGMRKNKGDAGEVWKNTQVSSEGKEIKIKFEMSREVAGTLLAKQVPAAKQSENK